MSSDNVSIRKLLDEILAIKSSITRLEIERFTLDESIDLDMIETHLKELNKTLYERYFELHSLNSLSKTTKRADSTQ